MPWYNDLRPASDSEQKDYALIFPQMEDHEKKRCIGNLLELRQGLSQNVARKIADQNLIIATWNIKEFGHTTQRLPESYFYIAEILNTFDLVIVQEIKSRLDDLEKVLRILGSDWKYLINDITEGDAGNSERSAIIYNSKRVRPSGLAGEIGLWDDLTQNSQVKQLKRSPYITGFRSGWKSFAIINLHLHPGKDADDINYRGEEIDLLLQAIDHKIQNSRFWSDKLILAGDMNLYYPIASKDYDKPNVENINSRGFYELNSLIGVDTNVTQSQSYDRLFFNATEYFVINTDPNTGQHSAGVFNYFDYIFKDSSAYYYRSHMMEVYGGSKDLTILANLQDYYNQTWKRNQISDHYPVWAELIIDSSDGFLRSLEGKL